jgi:hypothetical protein
MVLSEGIFRGHLDSIYRYWSEAGLAETTGGNEIRQEEASLDSREVARLRVLDSTPDATIDCVSPDLRRIHGDKTLWA